MKPERLSVMRCDLASCRGGIDGCNGSECRGARCDRVPPEQARELYGIGEVMTFDELVNKWQGPIGDWAIEKGWIKQERDPDYPDKMRNIPRDMLHLLMLMVTELAELETGLQNEDEANVREEVADFAIRAIQMRAEYGFSCQTGSTLSDLTEFAGDYNPSIYSMVADAAEDWRNKALNADQREVGVWGNLACAIATATVDNAADDSSMLEWLDAAIADKMEKNARRPYMHGKLA